MMMLAAVFVGGGFGAVLRFLCGLWEMRIFLKHDRPSDGRGTLLANTVACLFAGLFFAYFERYPSPTAQALLIAGLCGGLSTYSTLALELTTMMSARRITRSITLLALNIVCGGAALFAGISLVS